ncbi:SurA N-terminal domain-containing protein [Amphibacillus indicireducens]|uniref:Peptidylprolyl isomerase n=1 Tax=Amphibacillus indicireducens TaxID=1076330 RepID=A0ABP7VBR3_9BACI
MNRKWKLVTLLILAIITLAACNNNDKTEEQDSIDEIQQIEPDLSGIPDTVAEVNGQAISKERFELTYLSQFQQVALEAQLTGQAFDQEQFKQELAESMIDLELLIQEADRRQFVATDDDIDQMVTTLVEESHLESDQALYELYEGQGMSRDQLRAELTHQIKLDQLINDQAKNLQVTEEQIVELYEELIIVYEEMEQDGELPPMEEIRPDLESQIRFQEENLLIIELIEQLRGDAEIKNNL